MKSKKMIKLIVLIVLLILCVIAYKMLIKYNDKKDKEASDTESTAISIFDISKDSIKAVKYDKDGTEYIFEKSDDTWKYPADPDFSLDSSYIDTLAEDLSSLSAERKISDSQENLSDYGLDSPSKTITFTTNEGDFTVYIGDQNSITDTYYCYVSGDDSIYTISDTLYTDADYELSAMEEETTTEETSDTDETTAVGESDAETSATDETTAASESEEDTTDSASSDSVSEETTATVEAETTTME